MTHMPSVAFTNDRLEFSALVLNGTSVYQEDRKKEGNDLKFRVACWLFFKPHIIFATIWRNHNFSIKHISLSVHINWLTSDEKILNYRKIAFGTWVPEFQRSNILQEVKDTFLIYRKKRIPFFFCFYKKGNTRDMDMNVCADRNNKWHKLKV